MTPVEGLQGCWGAWGGRVHHRWIYPPPGPCVGCTGERRRWGGAGTLQEKKGTQGWGWHCGAERGLARRNSTGAGCKGRHFSGFPQAALSCPYPCLFGRHVHSCPAGDPGDHSLSDPHSLLMSFQSFRKPWTAVQTGAGTAPPHFSDALCLPHSSHAPAPLLPMPLHRSSPSLCVVPPVSVSGAPTPPLEDLG